MASLYRTGFARNSLDSSTVPETVAILARSRRTEIYADPASGGDVLTASMPEFLHESPCSRSRTPLEFKKDERSVAWVQPDLQKTLIQSLTQDRNHKNRPENNA